MGGINGDLTWDIFDSNQIPDSLIDYVKGAEISNKKASQDIIDVIFLSQMSGFDLALGLQYLEDDLGTDEQLRLRATHPALRLIKKRGRLEMDISRRTCIVQKRNRYHQKAENNSFPTPPVSFPNGSHTPRY